MKGEPPRKEQVMPESTLSAEEIARILTEQLMIIDATRKSTLDGHPRPWPGDVGNNKDIKTRGEERLEELGISHLFGE